MKNAFFEKINTKKRTVILIILGIIGLILVIVGTGNITEKNDDKIISDNYATKEYISSLENKIENITRQMTGSDEVAVIVSVNGGIEYIYVTNERQDGDTANREYVTVRGSDGSYGLALLREIYPEICGVTIVCKGGDNASLKFEIVNAISTALGVSSNRICVTGTK